MRESLALAEVHQLVADDGYALTFQTFGQYRTALMKKIGALFQAAVDHEDERRLERMPADNLPVPVLFLGGAADGRRQVMVQAPETYRLPVMPPPVFTPSLDMAAPYVERDVEIVEYRLDRIIDGETNKAHFLYVLAGLNTAAQLVAGYRAARS